MCIAPDRDSPRNEVRSAKVTLDSLTFSADSRIDRPFGTSGYECGCTPGCMAELMVARYLVRMQSTYSMSDADSQDYP
jgi:hypothetical protein